ncbi:MAG: DUF429 domain-containing protein [candidate division KSB1 bacterium]|nr:DUF429 domain-containing protein [candidate division KSB1 bacterium]MDQ7065261.1 DUF429 domain-containing protein [candidate division KSB1 bacterium]
MERTGQHRNPASCKGEVFGGIDGCRGGWLVVECDPGGRFRAPALVCKSMAELTEWFPMLRLALIDIPIGLADPPIGVRNCDAIAREMLGARRSTVFYPVIRQALQASSYAEACEIQSRLCLFKPSIQSWNLTPRIREVSEFLSQNPEWRQKLRESHPELCFRELNRGMPVGESKKTSAGRQLRLTLLKRLSPNVDEFFERTRQAFRHSQVADHDIVDAMVLALHAAMSERYGLVSIPARRDVNDAGEVMEIVYADMVDINELRGRQGAGGWRNA